MGSFGENLGDGQGYSAVSWPEARCAVYGSLLNGLLFWAELEEVSSHDHSFERVSCLDHVVLGERGLAFFRRLWARC